MASITTIDSTTTVTTTVVVPPAEEVATKIEEETPEQKEQRILTHKMLARQLEYYFSTANLSRDTYLSTLRDLNDSYVPVSIIANFGKVQALAPLESALEAVITAATDYSDLLEIVELDEEGKRIVTEEEEKKDESEVNSVIILAVGSISRKPIPMSQIQPTDKTQEIPDAPASKSQAPASDPEQNAAPTANTPGVQNTIIIREVAEDVEEMTLREFFTFEGCPAIESIREDLHNCWFVTLDTNSKDDMFDIMMKLRTTKYPNGDSVKARVKSSVATASYSPLTPNSVVFNPKISTMHAPQFRNNGTAANANSAGGNTNSRKKRSSNNKGRNGNNGGASASGKSKGTQQSTANTSKRRSGKEESSSVKPPLSGNTGVKNATGNKKKVAAKPPSMGESNFPSLPPTSEGNSKPFTVEKVPTEDEMLRSCEKERHAASGFSDSSSTATTSTASTPTEPPPTGIVAGGYAAALLKPAAPVPVAPKKVEAKRDVPQKQQGSVKGEEGNRRRGNKKGKDGNTVTQKSSPVPEPSTTEQPTVSVQPPSWGKGRSFADIVSA